MPVTEETASRSETRAESSQPEPFAVGDGNPDSLLCKASYTVFNQQIDPDETVAVMGDCALTAGQLQIRYYLTVDAYMQSGAQTRPEEGVGLEYQPCPLEEGLSWQHYFLKAALEQWHAQKALLQESEQEQVVSSDYFDPNPEWHEEYLSGELPSKQYIYGTKACYTPNSMHYAWLDGLPETLLELAKEKGFDTLEELTAAFAGTGTRKTDFLLVAREINRSYMYFTERSYDFDLSDASSAGKTVDIRHCLLIPEDGSEKSLAACKNRAEAVLKSWEESWLTVRNQEANFARVTNAKSQDENSSFCGGLYMGLHQGQLLEPLDDWCFDPERQPGDTAVIQSEQGFHILFFRGAGRDEEKAEELFYAAGEKLVAELAERYPMSVDYSAVCLGTREGDAKITVEEFLYPDVAHERFPEPIIYLQRDFMDAPYGRQKVGKVGCGITTLAMLTTYMTDEIHTPAQLAQKYPQYGESGGTDGMIFVNVPEEYGYFYESRGNNWEMVTEALKEGKMVVSLQFVGYFTQAGHYLLLWQLNDDGTVKIRDSNILNYGKLEGFLDDRFTKHQIMAANSIFYVFQKKITSYPECCRCGSGVESKILTDDYLCEKCTQALLRREGFLSMCAGK